MRAESPACRLAQGNTLGSCVPTTLRPEWATETFHIYIIGSRAGGEGERRRYAHTFAMDNSLLMQGENGWNCSEKTTLFSEQVLQAVELPHRVVSVAASGGNKRWA